MTSRTIMTNHTHGFSNLLLSLTAQFKGSYILRKSLISFLQTLSDFHKTWSHSGQTIFVWTTISLLLPFSPSRGTFWWMPSQKNCSSLGKRNSRQIWIFILQFIIWGAFLNFAIFYNSPLINNSKITDTVSTECIRFFVDFRIINA